MATDSWPTKRRSLASLHLDAKNPRLGRETSARAPREIIQYLFEHDKALDVAQSIAARGYFPNEPLLAINENDQVVVIEGNRRLAALKALREPGLLEGSMHRKLERLSHQLGDPNEIASVPVTLAPTRRATDRQVAGRHVGTPVLAWQAENRASFILDKLAEGYTNDQLRDRLAFTLADIQSARQTRAIADMARSLDLPEEVKAKLDNPRSKLFTTLERVFDSQVGRDYLKVERDSDHGIRGKTTKGEFLGGFTKLVTDIALGKQSSRTLNTSENIRDYFKSWDSKDRPAKKRGSFVPADIIQGRSVASASPKRKPMAAPKKSKHLSATVLPRDFKVRFGKGRLVDIRNELVKLKREDFPNAGVVLLRVFFELAVFDYLQRTGELSKIVKKLNDKGVRLRFGAPTMKQLMPEIARIAKSELTAAAAKMVEKAIRYDPSAPFTINELHGFVHLPDPPSARDIVQFWHRTEPLFRLMLEQNQVGETE
ncbi:MAG: hypothetical protein IID41_13845 [Planctomycetes bacterium]|nr:hypothetical protein [Planctomycetota bacterium]